MASVSGPFIALLDLVGGILLLLGVAGRWLGLLYAIEFAVAFFYVKLPAGFQGARLDLMLLAGGLLIFLAGPGKAALDAYWLETEGDRVTGSWSARPEESERGVRRPARLARPPSRHPRRAFRSLRNRRLARADDGDEGKQLVTRFDQRGADAIHRDLRDARALTEEHRLDDDRDDQLERQEQSDDERWLHQESKIARLNSVGATTAAHTPANGMKRPTARTAPQRSA